MAFELETLGTNSKLPEDLLKGISILGLRASGLILLSVGSVCFWSCLSLILFVWRGGGVWVGECFVQGPD